MNMVRYVDEFYDEHGRMTGSVNREEYGARSDTLEECEKYTSGSLCYCSNCYSPSYSEVCD